MKIKILIAICLLQVSWCAKACADENWTEYRSRHFRIYYRSAPRNFVKNIEDMAERYYDEITRNMGFFREHNWTFDDRAQIYIYDSQQEYVNSAQIAGWSHGSADPKDKIIRTFPAAHGFFDSTLPHELGHIIFREFVGQSKAIPLWFEEGVAMYQEKARRWGVDAIVKEAIEDGSFIPLEQLSRVRLYKHTEQKFVELFYAESASVVNFLIDLEGEQKFFKFLRKMNQGSEFIVAFKSTYRRFDNIDDLDRVWMQSLKRKNGK